MSVLSAIFDANKIFNYEQALGVKDVTTQEMRTAIKDWYALYYNKIPTKEEDPSQQLPAALVGKLYKAIFSEYSAAPAKDGGKAEFIAAVLGELDLKRKTAVQQMLIGGLCLIKPVLSKRGGFSFGVINRQNMLIFGRDDHGNVTDLGISEQTIEGKTVYTLLERRTVDDAGFLTIESRLYASETNGVLGREIPLSSLDKYASIVPVNRLPAPVFSVGLIPLSCPAENCVDGSADAVSVYAAAVGLIHSINRNEAQLNQEFENGKMRLIVPDTMLKRRHDGTRGLDDAVFVGAPPDVDGNTNIVAFSPELREQSYLARKTENLRNIESLIGLKRGLLSDVEAAEKTATEITSSAGEYNLTIKDFQDSWERCVRETARVCNVLGQMYGLTDSKGIDPEKDVAVSWGNGILYDEDKEWATLMQLVSAGLLKPEITLAWKFDLPWDKPEDLAKIREKYMPPEQKTEDGKEWGDL